MHSPKGPSFQVGVPALKLINQFLYLLPLGISVGGAGAVDYWQLQPLSGVLNEIFPTVEQGTDLGDHRPVQVGDGLESGQPSLEKQGHE